MLDRYFAALQPEGKAEAVAWQRDHYKKGLETLASTFYKDDQHQDYARHVLGTAALSQPEGKAEATDGYELAETVHGEIVRIVKRHNPLKEDIQPSGQTRAEIIEECAKVADKHPYYGDEVAEAIRALAAQEKEP